MEEENNKAMEFAYDLFRLGQQNKLVIIEIGENTDGKYFVELGNREPESIEKLNEVLKELSEEIEIISKQFSMDGTWIINFELDSSILKNYQSKETNYKKDSSSIIVVQEDEKEEEEVNSQDDDRKGVKIIEQKDGVTVYADGVIEIDIHPWQFNVVPKALANMIGFMPFVSIIQAYDWTNMVGLFLGDEEFKENEAGHSDRISGRWVIKGISPVGEIYYYEIHDAEGGDVPHIYAKSTYGVEEMYNWLIEKFKDKSPIEYTRKFILPNKKKAEFGIDKNGHAWQSWNRCGWLTELGLG